MCLFSTQATWGFRWVNPEVLFKASNPCWGTGTDYGDQMPGLELKQRLVAPSVPGLHAWITPLLGKGPLREFREAMAK